MARLFSPTTLKWSPRSLLLVRRIISQKNRFLCAMWAVLGSQGIVVKVGVKVNLSEILRWLTTVFKRLKSARYDFLPVVNIARADKNCASNSKTAQTSFST